MASNAQINLRELFTQHNDAISVSVLEGVNRAINSFIDREIADLTEYAMRDILRPLIRDALREYVRRLLPSQNMGVEVFTNILGEMLPPPYEPPTQSGGDDAVQSGGGDEATSSGGDDATPSGGDATPSWSDSNNADQGDDNHIEPFHEDNAMNMPDM